MPAAAQRHQLLCRYARCHTGVPATVQMCQMSCRGASHCADVLDAVLSASCCANVPDTMQMCQLLCRCARRHAGVPALHPLSPGFDGKWPLSAVMGMACGDVRCSKKMLIFPPLHHGCQGPAVVPASPGHVLLHFCSDFAKNALLRRGETGLLCCLAQFLIVFSTMIFLSFFQGDFFPAPPFPVTPPPHLPDRMS